MIAKRKSTLANANNHLAITEGADICCGDNTLSDYATAAADVSASDVVAVNVTVPGGSAATVSLDGQPIDWSSADNDQALIQAIGKVAVDLGYEWMKGGIELERSGNNLTVKVKDSALVWNWIGTASSDEKAFTATLVS